MRVMGDMTNVNVLRGSLHLSAYGATLSELAWIVEQRHVQTILDQALRFTPNVQRINATATNLVISDSGVNLSTSSGETLYANLLIGADGANSWVRNALNIETEIFDYQHFGVVANFSISKPHQNTAYQWFLSDGEALALLPLPNQMVSMVYSCTETHADIWCNASSDELSAHIGELSSHTLGALTALTQTQRFPLKRQRAKQLISERALLISDAAHTMHPLAGQGLNLGLQDVAALLDILTHSQSSESHRAIYDPILLRRYERACATPTFEMQSVTHALQRLFASHHPVLRHLRNVGMNTLDIIPPLKRRLIQKAMGHTPSDVK
jgi:ubiquinone biosynthesis UbiH/UbiF/VisC/COQ6 family hydroxylase